IPQNRVQAKTSIPGFPSTEITHPNIRFQQNRPMPKEVTRTDAMPLKYLRDEEEKGIFKAAVDDQHRWEKHWNLKKLLTSHESAHVIFTLCTQATVGAFIMTIAASWLGLPSLAALQEPQLKWPLLIALVMITTTGLFKLNMHLGKPHRFYRGFNNLRWSPVSREIAGVSLFYTGLLGYVFFALFDHVFARFLANGFAFIGVAGGAIGLFYMYKLYRIPARPFWNHWQTGSAFFGSMLGLGALIITAVSTVALPSGIESSQALLHILALIMMTGLALEGVGHLAHAHDMRQSNHEGAASYYRQVTQYGKSYIFRNILLGISLMLTLFLALHGFSDFYGLIAGLALLPLMLASSAFGRSLFFVLVIPTTMPGAFFWKNSGFIEHARETGLAEMPQHGVAYEHHHPFKVEELLETIKENSIQDMIAHVKGIFGK
ncbi:MAG: dimethyl sulfoxide reductase anchor subunit family protein, partial [Methylobacter sp.]